MSADRKNQKLYGFGMNREYQCGNYNTTKKQAKPYEFTKEDIGIDGEIVNVICAATGTIIVCE